ncbi:bifunctional isochorismate lyase/aryl carrier protein [Murinocardiopsis flavida]|uniref:Bifunctional isochorismate lyase/aryl carrier protein n=1 Tax=Murinocardiopsis flavida TaxID=645275 RepID=A0A2P8DLP7_9ACTN|nr:isochorismatase family protein [Murinocardiopsis flavida]PSK98149.1 bifunctional isochorismate lyase/aryl carrier protein [Murinocardiopsis flavida]
MALPQIDSYRLPREEDLPANRAPWIPDPERAVLLIHDMQHYFLRGYDPAGQPLAPVVANIAALRGACRDAGIPTVYTAKPGGMDPDRRGLERDFWGPGMAAVPEQTAIAAPLAPGGDDTLVTKWRYSAFVQTDLAERMRRSGRDQIIVTGVYAHIGCLLTAADAFMRDIEPFVVADAMADFSAEDHMFAVRYAARRCAVAMTSAAVLTAIAGAVPAASGSG